jgi:hypothetical protein
MGFNTSTKEIFIDWFFGYRFPPNSFKEVYNLQLLVSDMDGNQTLHGYPNRTDF